MMGTLLRMSGAPTREEINELVLRWLVLAEEGGEAELYDTAEIGGHLLKIHELLNQPEDDEEAARDPLLGGQDLYNVMFKAFADGHIPRIRRELKRRGLEFDHVDREWVRDREAFGFQDSFDLSTAVFTTSFAKEVGRALGEISAADSIQIWAYSEKMDKERASV